MPQCAYSCACGFRRFWGILGNFLHRQYRNYVISQDSFTGDGNKALGEEGGYHIHPNKKRKNNYKLIAHFTLRWPGHMSMGYPDSTCKSEGFGSTRKWTGNNNNININNIVKQQNNYRCNRFWHKRINHLFKSFSSNAAPCRTSSSN